MKKLSLIAVVFMLILFVNGAHAAYIVDTGVDPDGSSLNFDSGSWLAGEFVLDNSTKITDIEGYMQKRPGEVTITIYNDGGVVPGSTEFFSESFLPSEGGASFTSDWVGFSSLNLDLAPGTYWVSFEVRGEGEGLYDGLMKPALNRLPVNAYKTVDGWVAYGPTPTPIRIQGYASSVPIPGAVWLLGSGLIGLVGLKKKFKK